ncbi:hypothetical protein MKX03_021825 [Papaver bracteatum]|nr:hypothetical protein MKX03_021825 [Papaver bracteatum]
MGMRAEERSISRWDDEHIPDDIVRTRTDPGLTPKRYPLYLCFLRMLYRLDENTCYIDYDQLEKSATLFRPKLIVGGASPYSRFYGYARIHQVCDKQKAILLADMAHISGLVAAGSSHLHLSMPMW